MKVIQKIMPIVILVLGFSNCSSSKQLQDSAPFKVGDTYFQESKSEINLYVSIKSNPNNVKLDSVYFRNQQSKLKLTKDNLFLARFNMDARLKTDIIMSSDPQAEYGNKAPKLTKQSPFQLQENECAISFQKGNKTKYFKIKGLTKK